jgi:hypothetical protein
MNILQEADHLTAEDRRAAYDHPAPNHKRIAAFWNVYLAGRPDPGAPISPSDVVTMMILLKVARNQYQYQRDNVVDIAGYARCLEMI